MQSNGKEKLIATIHEIERIASRNECQMGDIAMSAIASGVLWLVKYISRPNEYSLEEVSLKLGISVRHLRRLLKTYNIKTHRRGFTKVFLLQQDIDMLVRYREK